MVIGGGIGPGYTQGQEGKLQATATFIQGEIALCLVAVDVLMMHRDTMDSATAQIAEICRIPPAHVMINASHTHHAPSTVTVHGYERDEEFCLRTVDAIVAAARLAQARARTAEPARGYFHLGQEATVGQNSRQRLDDGQIYWIGPRDGFVGPTDPFDPDFPVIAFRNPAGHLQSAWFNHSTHCIGTRSGRRSPGFYGLAAQELTDELGAPVTFFSGAAGSTHNLDLDCEQMVQRIKSTFTETLEAGVPMSTGRLAAIRRQFPYTVRLFDEQAEDRKVVEYCRKYAPAHEDAIVNVFRESRRKLKTQQGQERNLWLQVLQVGDVCLVAVPAEFFTVLGMEIKRRSPFPNTFVCGLSNDYVGYLPNRAGFDLGGYQTWMGLHSFAEIGTGEAVVEQCVEMLQELAQPPSRPTPPGNEIAPTDSQATPTSAAVFRAGVDARDISPTEFPRIIAGGFLEGRGDQNQDRLFVRSFVLDDGQRVLALSVVDTCMMPQALIDEAKQLVAKRCGIPTEHLLVSATHTHSAPAAMGCLGTRLDVEYAAGLPEQIAASIEAAYQRRAPARIGWAAIDDWRHTHNRRWIRHPDRLIVDPFGQATGRAHMHPGHESPDVIGPSGPVDPELSLIGLQLLDGTPLGVIANYGQHYYGAPAISADYFGIFAKYIADYLAQPGDGNGPFVCAMSQGTSGDLATMDYGAPARSRDMAAYAAGVAQFAEQALQTIVYHDHVTLAAVEKRLPLRYRVPDPERLAWAESVAAGIEDDLPRSLPEVYAREALILHERQATELKLQALRIGDLTIAALPNEVYALTGLKLKARAPTGLHFNIELANGAEGYIPPPEQHELGGYTTWPARTAGLEVEAEPKIVESLLTALEEVTAQPRRIDEDRHGSYARAVLAAQPTHYWRLNDADGRVARNAISNGGSLQVSPGFAWYLPGVGSGSGVAQEVELTPSPFSGPTRINRAVHLAGGHLEAMEGTWTEHSSVGLWFYLGEKSGARQRSGQLVTLPDGTALIAHQFADHQVQLQLGDRLSERLYRADQWNFVVLCGEPEVYRVHINGGSDPVIVVPRVDIATAHQTGDAQPLAFGRELLGKLDEIAVWDRTVTSEEMVRLWELSEVPWERERQAAERQRIAAERLARIQPPDFAVDYGAAIESLRPQVYSSLQNEQAFDAWSSAGNIALDESTYGNFSGGRLQSRGVRLFDRYTVSTWFRCETAADVQAVTAYLLSIGPDADPGATGDHLGIGGTYQPQWQGKLIFFNGNARDQVAAGRTAVPIGAWNQVVVVREGTQVRVFLNGQTTPEIDAQIDNTLTESQPLFLGARSDRFAPLVGQLAHVAAFDRPLTSAEVATLYTASGQPIGTAEPLPAVPPDTPEPTSQPLSPAESLSSIHVPVGFRVELVAAEPQVLDPVAFDWDAQGRLWVVEMADYPLGMDGAGQPGGRIRCLTDTDGDGYYESSQLFADGLNFPNGILTWGRGVLVTAAPEILYLEDTTGDGRADRREVWFSGFNEGNQQLRVNGLRWGLDGWVYCANGGHHAGHGTEIQILSHRQGTRLTIGSRDFRFHPLTGEMQVESGPSQFGRNRNAWGHWFGTQNANPLWQYVIPARYLDRNPYVPAPNPIRHVVGAGSPPVYPASPLEKRYHSFDQSGRFTSACGGMVYGDERLFGQSEWQHSFVCEPFHNLVQHNVMIPSGPSYTAQRASGEEAYDFFASEDRWCRPVMVRTGPDGGLWIADMYRYMIEHPDWLPAEGRAELLPHYRLGETRGRIYRVVPSDSAAGQWPHTQDWTITQWLAALDSPNDWWRDQAQQQILWQLRESSVDDTRSGETNLKTATQTALQQLVLHAHYPQARVQALHLLRNLGTLCEASFFAEATIVAGLSDGHPRVRETAVAMAEELGTPEVIQAATSLSRDPDARVRFQLALTCGQWSDPAAGVALAEVARQDFSDDWVVAAVMTSAVPHQATLVLELLTTPGGVATAFREPLLRQALGSQNPAAVALMLQQSLQGDFAQQCQQLGGFLAALQRLNLSWETWTAETHDPKLAAAVQAANRVILAAREQLQTPTSDRAVRAAAATLLTRLAAERESAVTTLGEELVPQVDAQRQAEVIAAIAQSGAENAPLIFRQAWEGLSPGLRQQVVDAWLSRQAWTTDLLERLEREDLPRGTLDLTQQARLLQHPQEALARRAQALFARPTRPQEILHRYRPALQLDGDPLRGRVVFIDHCANCHRRGEMGHDVGPNLASVLNHSPEKLLTNILDPNVDIQPGYHSFTCLLETGEVLVGVLSGESTHSLTLTQANGVVRTILRSEIDALKNSGISLMPEGLEEKISPDAMADLLAFLRSPIPN
jgi:putative membrane-bound dehydrogenase-like protein